MSGRGKRKDEADQASDENESHAPPSKFAKTTADSDDSGDIVVCEISKNRRVTVRSWQRKIWVDIREFYVKDGKQLPGKKADLRPITISFILFTSEEDITQLLSWRTPYFELAKFYAGISLSLAQWNVLRDHVDQIDKALAESSA